MERINDKGLQELTEELFGRKWNVYSLISNDLFLIDNINALFYFSEKDEIKKKGYDVDIDVVRKKLFISYCHKDREIVNTIVEKLRLNGFSFWLDQEEIDIGDNIIQKISEGIRECDVAVLFLSENTLTANLAKHELQTYFVKTVSNEKKIAPVLLDDVNADDIIEGLCGYNYFKYDNENIDELIKLLKRKIANI